MSTNPFSDPYQDPYRSPQFATPQPMLPAGRPAVMTWYLVYCGAMALLYLLCVTLGGGILAYGGELDHGEDMADGVYIQGMILLVMGGAMLLLYGAAFVLPRGKFAWIYGFITIGIGFTSLCTMPFSIALLIFWLKPELKAYLNVH